MLKPIIRQPNQDNQTKTTKPYNTINLLDDKIIKVDKSKLFLLKKELIRETPNKLKLYTRVNLTNAL